MTTTVATKRLQEPIVKSQNIIPRVIMKTERNQAARTGIRQEIGLEKGLAQETEQQMSTAETTVLDQSIGIDLNSLWSTRVKRQRERTGTTVLDVVGTLAQIIIPEIGPKKDQEKDVKEENTARSMNQELEIDLEKERDAPEPLAQNVEETETNPAMGEGEGPAKRP